MNRASEFWDREIIHQTHVSWMEHSEVRKYINDSVSEGRGLWPIDWFESYLGGRRFARALSIGCGGGPLERDLIRRGLCSRCDAFDGSPQSIAAAQAAAREAGIEGSVHYYVGDFNEPELPKNTYDIVFFHQSLHHVGKLEKLFRAVMRSLKRDGLLYLDEYIGPSRTDWNDQTIALQRLVFESAVPVERRTTPSLPLPIQPDDPSEALRSGEIMKELRVGFEIDSYHPYGGNLLSVLFPFVDWRGSDGAALIGRLIEAERRLLADGQESFHAVIVARPKRGFAGWFARGRYFFVPKAKRVLTETRRRLSS